MWRITMGWRGPPLVLAQRRLKCLGRPQLIRMAFSRYLWLTVLCMTKLTPGLQKVVLLVLLSQLVFSYLVVLCRVRLVPL